LKLPINSNSGIELTPCLSMTPSHTVHNTDVTFDTNFNFRKHFLCCFCHIRDLHHIRHYFSLSVTKTIDTALITSSLDYCNSLLYNITSKDIRKLQCVQKCLVMIVTWSPQFFSFCATHWLPVQSHIIFKLSTISY